MFFCLKVVKPLWYFHLRCGDKIFWPDPHNLLLSQNFDSDYDSKESAISDASFFILMKGYIYQPINSKNISESTLNYNHTPDDEFKFLRKYFHPMWSIVYIIYCIMFFRNIAKNFKAFLKTFDIKRVDIYKKPIAPCSLELQNDFEKIDFKKNIRVIIPTYNRYDELKNLLTDLEEQDYSKFSITIIDQSETFNKEFYKSFKLNINLVRQERPALWRARNFAIKNSNEEIIALLDDDSRIQSDWLTKHLYCMDYYNVSISAGISISKFGAKVPLNYHFYRISDQLDTGNVVFMRKVIFECGYFDEQFEAMRMGDSEFGLRAYKKGIIAISNPEAKRLHLKTNKGGLRDNGSWDAFRPTNIFKPRPIPSVLYLARKYFGNYSAFIFLLINIPLSLTKYSKKSNYFSLIKSVFIFFLLFPIIMLQTIFSWRLSSKILANGNKIPK